MARLTSRIPIAVRKIWIILFFMVLHYVPCNGQGTSWLRVGTGVNGQLGRSITTDKYDNVIVGGGYHDSFTIASKHFSFSGRGSAGQQAMLMKYDSAGTFLWGIQSYITGYLHECWINGVATDDSANIYALVGYNGSANFGSGFVYTTGGGVLLKVSPSGALIWGRNIGSGSGGYNTDLTIDNNNNVIVSFSHTGTVTFSGTTQTISVSGGGSQNYGVVKYTHSGVYVASATFGNSGLMYSNAVGTDAAGNIYLHGYNASSFTFGSNTVLQYSFVLKTSPLFTPYKAISYNPQMGTFYKRLMGVEPNGNVTITGLFSNTVDFGGISLTATGSVNQNHYFAYFDSTLSLRWVKKESATGASVIRPSGGICIRNNNIYSGGTLQFDSTKFGSSVVPYVSPAPNMYLVKVDTLGNFLWAFGTGLSTGGANTTSVTVDSDGNGIVLGGFSVKITIFNKTDSGQFSDFFVAKIIDYNITRGPVSAGPYCAGDTIIIPYTKRGGYKPGNEFIAELSDSAGNFDNGGRELGRIKTTKDSVIYGTLPLFNVASNNRYRIRILSTDPVVQSFYKLDTLRLLIYSRDTANAGPDTAICRGTSIRLGTTGGTAWNWWPPKYIIPQKDTANRQPLIKPDSAIEYRIIISDSSGCGVTDTDYVKVTVRPYISGIIDGDSSVCKGGTLVLKAKGFGGDSVKYWYQWKAQGVFGVIGTSETLTVSPVKTTQYSVTIGDSCTVNIYTANFTVTIDTIFRAKASPDTVMCKGKNITLWAGGSGCNPQYYKYRWYEAGKTVVLGNDPTLMVSPVTTTSYKVVVSDSTTSLKDSVIIKVTVDDLLSVTANPDDSICTGQSFTLTAGVISCDTSDMEYIWDNGLGNGPVKTVSPTATTTYIVKGTNKFNGLTDTARVIVTVLPPLNLTVSSDTTICVGESVLLRSYPTGGKPSGYEVSWIESGGGWIVLGDSFPASPTKTTTYMVLLNDHCSPEQDTAYVTVIVRPPLKATVNADTTICIGETAELRVSLAGGYVPNYSLVWSEVGGPWSVGNAVTTVNPTVTTTYRAVLTDNCTKPGDSAEVTITVRPSLKVTVNSDTTICVGETAELRATLLGGNVPSHSLLWTVVGGPWTSNNPTETVNPTTTTTYRAVLTDNCTTPGDSAEVTVTVRPPLQLNTTSSSDSICGNQTVVLSATISGGLSSSHSLLWTADSGPWTSAQNPTSDQPKTTSQYIARLSDNCSPDVYDTLTVFVIPAPKANFDFTPKEGCPPLKVTFTDLSAGNDTTLNTWKVQATEAKGISQYVHEFLTPGTYSVGLSVDNNLGCIDQKIVNGAITVFEKPTAQFIAKPDIKEIESPIYLYHQSSRAVKYTWDFGDGNYLYQNNNNDTQYIYTEPGEISIKLIAENYRGCLDTQTQLIRVFDKINCVIPNAFTPNNRDDLNPTFAPVCVGAASYQMTIFNRWGQVIQSCENCAWDGTFADKPVPAGVYLYKLIITAESKKEATSFGTLNVVR